MFYFTYIHLSNRYPDKIGVIVAKMKIKMPFNIFIK